jgi:hypothetical protein
MEKIFKYRDEFSAELLRAKNVFKFLGLLNVKYIEQRNDFGEKFINARITPRQSAEYMKKLLGSLRDISLCKEFGKLDFYENKYWVPKVYIDYSPLVINAGLEALPGLIESDILDRQRSVFFAQDLPRVDNYSREFSLKKVAFRKVNPTKFILTFSECPLGNSFWVILSESFHPGWKAWVYTIKSKRELKVHKIINGYANAWLVSGNDLRVLNNPGARIIVEYTPQRFYRLAIIISLFTLIFCLWYLILFRRVN